MTDQDRVLVQEFPPLSLVADTATGVWAMDSATEYRAIETTTYPNLNYWLSESKIDLSGYAMDDLTLFFRNSFEQQGGFNSIAWNADREEPLTPFATPVLEQIIVSSIPFTDEQLTLTFLSSPGFTPFSLPNVDVGNFNRTHIIHGHFTILDIHLDQVVDPSADGAAFLYLDSENYYSSLEPTAADCLYCYRVFQVPNGAAATAEGPDAILLAPKRVIMTGMIGEEPTLEYMMRLKRSYELANQV